MPPIADLTRRRLLATATALMLPLAVPGLARFAQAAAPASPLDLAEPIAQYKIYVLGEVRQLVRQTRSFADAIKAGDLAKARSLYAPTRVHYERIEPIAELFDDLDKSIDSRADDHDEGEKDAGLSLIHI